MANDKTNRTTDLPVFIVRVARYLENEFERHSLEKAEMARYRNV